VPRRSTMTPEGDPRGATRLCAARHLGKTRCTNAGMSAHSTCGMWVDCFEPGDGGLAAPGVFWSSSWSESEVCNHGDRFGEVVG